VGFQNPTAPALAEDGANPTKTGRKEKIEWGKKGIIMTVEMMTL
jgi:hypothetical protein